MRVADLEAQSKADRDKDAKFAASNPKTQLPSGSNQYRHLADYDLEMKQLAMRYPGLVKELTLHHPTIEGRGVNGIEITQNPQARGRQADLPAASASTTRVSGRRRSTRSSSPTTC